MDYFHSPLPALVFESQGALGCQWRIGFNSDNNVSEVEIIGRVVTIVKANIENKLSIPTIRATHCGAESVDPPNECCQWCQSGRRQKGAGLGRLKPHPFFVESQLGPYPPSRPPTPPGLRFLENTVPFGAVECANPTAHPEKGQRIANLTQNSMIPTWSSSQPNDG